MFTFAFLLSVVTFTHAERAYNVEKTILPEYQLVLPDGIYILDTYESQVLIGEDWQSTQKAAYIYDNSGMLTSYVVTSLQGNWLDSTYNLFFYNSLKQPISYWVSQSSLDTIENVSYKDYFYYSALTNKLDSIKRYYLNSTGALANMIDEKYFYSANFDMDSTYTVYYDEEPGSIAYYTSEKLNYINDTVYSITQNTFYSIGESEFMDLGAVEYQYVFSSNGKKIVDGMNVFPDMLTDLTNRTVYAWRAEDGLMEESVTQNMDLSKVLSVDYIDTLKTSYTYSVENSIMTRIATTSEWVVDKWVPISRTVDKFRNNITGVKRNNMIVARKKFNVNARLVHSNLSISSTETIKAIELYSINGVLLHRMNTDKSSKSFTINLEKSRIANFSGPIVAKVLSDKGLHSVQKVFQIR